MPLSDEDRHRIEEEEWRRVEAQIRAEAEVREQPEKGSEIQEEQPETTGQVKGKTNPPDKATGKNAVNAVVLGAIGTIGLGLAVSLGFPYVGLSFAAGAAIAAVCHWKKWGWQIVFSLCIAVVVLGWWASSRPSVVCAIPIPVHGSVEFGVEAITKKRTAKPKVKFHPGEAIYWVADFNWCINTTHLDLTLAVEYENGMESLLHRESMELSTPYSTTIASNRPDLDFMIADARLRIGKFILRFLKADQVVAEGRFEVAEPTTAEWITSLGAREKQVLLGVVHARERGIAEREALIQAIAQETSESPDFVEQIIQDGLRYGAISEKAQLN